MKIVYTAIIGPYDTLKEPQVISQGWRYLCFTDQPVTSKIWEKVDIAKWDNPILLARRIKLMPHLYLPQGTESMWVDASFEIACDLNVFWDKYMGGQVMGVIRHPIRDCIYDEIDVCIQNKRANPDDLQRQSTRYSKMGIPRNGGLIQSGILMRRDTSEVRNLSSIWWDQVQLFSTRDQVAFGYVWNTFKDVIKIKVVKDFDYRMNPYFIFSKHVGRMENHTHILQFLMYKNHYFTYLEIGVQNKANNFNHIPAKFKIGVDPDPLAEADFVATSDDFFNTTPNLMYQLIFIDGLHHRDQVRRDFINALKHLSEGGTIMIHDTYPEAENLTHVPRDKRGRWLGDVYKFVAYELWEFPIDFFTLPFDNGITIVTWSKERSLKSGVIQDQGWEYFDKNKNQLLNVKDVSWLFKM